MKKIISTIVAVGLVSSLLVNTAYAGGHHGGGFNPLWVPVAILSTLVAAVTFPLAPVVHEQRVVYEPRQTFVYQDPPRVVYEEPRYRRHPYHDERSYDDRGRGYESPRYRDYR